MATKKKPISKMRVAFILFGITIPILSWLVFYLYPNFSAIVMAFKNGQGAWSLDNFAKFFREFEKPTSEIRIAFKNTFITFVIGLVAFPFHVLVPFFIYKKIPFYKFYRIVFFFPSIIFSVAIAMVFTQLVGTEGAVAGFIQDVLKLDYVPELLADSRFANFTVWAHLLWITFPGDLIVWSGTFARIPEDVLEAGRIDGVNWWTEFTRIILPMVWPTFALQMVLLTCGIFSASGSVFLLTNGEYGTMTLTAWMYLTLYRGSGSAFTSNIYNYMSAVGLLLTTVAIILSVSIRKLTDKVFDEVEF